MGTIRFLLAISVVIAHAGSVYGFTLLGGAIAVQSFYMISGFYMTLILNEKYIGKNNSYKLFISNRLLRLYPIYWTILLVTLFLSIGVFIFSSGQSIGSLRPYYNNISIMNIESISFLILSNIIIFFQDTIYFLGLDTGSGGLYFTKDFHQTNPQLCHFLLLPHAWTIGIEITFYLLAPFIVRKKVCFIILLALVSILLRVLLYQNGFRGDPWSYRFFPTELLFFMLGTIAYHVYKKLDQENFKKSYLNIIYGFILLFTLSYSLFSVPYKIYFYFLIFFLGLPYVFILSKKWKIDRYVGELSYPIYISHVLVIMIVDHLKISIIGSISLVTIILTILFSIILNEFIAKKVELIRQNRLTPTANKV